ncbi:hypothetical protein BHE74_00034247, partial [Ensete ventricosum]
YDFSFFHLSEYLPFRSRSLSSLSLPAFSFLWLGFVLHGGSNRDSRSRLPRAFNQDLGSAIGGRGGLINDSKAMDLEKTEFSSDGKGAAAAPACSICLELVLDQGRRSTAKLQCGHEFHLGDEFLYPFLHDDLS